ncbi:hypothetical protein KC360_g1888 [Hortaea werneckii]|nr:hypothetical protein KC325_g2468 [Hortaea werneckii]KAI6997056.1 hypothetical protein KC359_g3118 [Hortaea werneckii]KAI7148114.1 hypothetical protein KC344_g2273 [Hortaea werneckii]KAI7177968.1 hypothetical protein KC360_g1888 [Hortaea werneckii]
MNLFSSYSDDEDDIDHDHSDHDPDQHIPRQRRRRESLFRDAMASNESYQHSRDALPDPSAAAADNAAGQSRRPDRPRPGVKRHSSLPQTLFASGSASIFGSGRSPSMESDQSPPSHPPNQAESVNSSRNAPSEANPVPEASSVPRLSVSHPSQEQLPVSRPPLSAIGGRNRLPSTTRRAHFEDEVRSTADRRIIPNVEKDADDPTNPPATSSTHGRHRSNTLTTLSRLFAVRASTSPDASRQGSYLQQHPSAHHYGTSLSHRNLQTTSIQLGDLPDHLFTRGLLEGRHSDITVIAFNHPYRLHRLILDRAPFFTSALSAPWLESAAKEITVHPSDLDPNITQTAFELALKRLYGCSDPVEEEPEAIGLFAVGCWLEMKDLIDSAIESILRQMSPETLSPLIRLVTMNYYGRAGEKILASAKAMLCRDGSSMPLRFWSGIPADIVREMVGGDGFYIEGELERWVLAKRILDRRLKVRAYEAGLTVPSSSSSSSGLTGRSSTRRRRVIKKVPLEYWPRLTAVRFDSISTTSLFSPPVRRGPRSSSASSHANPPFYGGSKGLRVGGAPDALHAFISLYTHPDIEPLLVLLDEGIHYIHLDFESLQFIRGQRDILGFPVMPEKVVNDALWMQMELRQKVINAAEGGLELGLSLKWTEEEEEVYDGNIATGHHANDHDGTPTKGKEKASEYPPPQSPSGHQTSSSSSSPRTSQISSGSWDSNGLPRKFWIPASDCNIVMGGNADPVIATSNTTTLQRHAQQQQQQQHHHHHQGRYSLNLDPRDVQWASDFGAATAQPLGPSSRAPGTRGHPHDRAAVPGGGGGAAGGGPGGPNTTNPADPSPSSSPNPSPPTQTYSHFPPFRFVAEFPPPRLLKERKRIYSQTVFYAGSLWNLYVQKVSTGGSRNGNAGGSSGAAGSGSGGKQLGVYLHRAKERGDGDGSGAGSAASGGSSGRPSLEEQRNLRASVDERIGVLEREMRVRREREREVLGLGPDGRRMRRSRRGVVGGGGGSARADLEAGGQGRGSPASITTTGGNSVGGGSGGSLARQENPGSNTRPSLSSAAAAGPSIGNETASTPEQDSIRAAYPSGSSEETMFTPASVESEWDSPDEDFGDDFDADDADLRDLEDFLDDDDDDSDYDEALDLDEYGTFVSGPGREAGGGGGQYPATSPTSTTSHHPPPPPHHPHPHPPSTIPALPPYIDVRPTIKTYFKIFSPSRAGRMLSLYESAPDKFNFSQSWGWKSSTLMLDEGILGDGGGAGEDTGGADAAFGAGNGADAELVAAEDGVGGAGVGVGVGVVGDELGGGGGGGRVEDAGGVLPRDPPALPGLLAGNGGAPMAPAGGMDGFSHPGRGRGGGGVGAVGAGAGETAFASPSNLPPPSSRAPHRSSRPLHGTSGASGGSDRRRRFLTTAAATSTTASAARGTRGKGDGKLRFMVVIGNI